MVKMIINHEHVKGRKRGCRGVCYCLVLEFLALNYKKALYTFAKFLCSDGGLGVHYNRER